MWLFSQNKTPQKSETTNGTHAYTPSTSPSKGNLEEVPVAKQVYLALDSARKHPELYVKLLETYKSYFLDDEEGLDPNAHKRKTINNNNYRPDKDRRRLLLPGAMEILTTKEGTTAVDDAIEFLRQVDPSKLPPLKFSEGLGYAARDLVVSAGSKGVISDVDAEGAGMDRRADRYGEWIDAIGENTHYGDHTVNIGTSIVLDWIVDDGVPTRGHRLNVFSDQFSVVGVYYAVHKKYRHMCVATFAGGFIEEKQIPKSPRVKLAELGSTAKPFVKQIMLTEDDKVVDVASPISSQEIQRRATVTVTSPSPDVTQVTRTFFTSSVPRDRSSSVNQDLAERYNQNGIPLVDSRRKKFSVTPKKPVPGKQKLVHTSIFKEGREKVLDVKVEPVYADDLRGGKRQRTAASPAEEKGWFTKVVGGLFGN